MRAGSGDEDEVVPAVFEKGGCLFGNRGLICGNARSCRNGRRRGLLIRIFESDGKCWNDRV